MQCIFKILGAVMLASFLALSVIDWVNQSRKEVTIDGVTYLVEGLVKTEHQFGVVLNTESNVFNYVDKAPKYLAKVRENPNAQVMKIELDRETFIEIERKLSNVTGYRKYN